MMWSMVVPFLAAAAVTCAPPPATARPRADRPHYTLALRVASPFRVVTGDLSVRFTPNRPTDRLVFRLWPNGPLERRHGSSLEPGVVTSRGERLRAERPDPTTLIVRLPNRLSAEEDVTVRVPWRLQVPRDPSNRNSRFPGGLRLGTFFPLLAWDPRRGWVRDPAAHILAESSTAPAADFDVSVRAPKGLRTIVSGDSAGAGRWHAAAVRDIAVAVGRFRVATGTVQAPHAVAVRVAYLGGQGDRILAMAKSALARLAHRYGAYPWKTFSVVVPPEFFAGGIEYPTLVYVGPRPFTRIVVDHETAHQWFYSLVGNDQARDPWLDETLATWGQVRLGSAEPRPRRPVPPSARRHVGAPMTYWNRLGRGYYWGAYGEGVHALHSLGDDEKVDCALRSYAARRAYSIARQADLLDELNAVIPGAEQRLREWGIRRR
jgi:peptidase M1-like protein